MGFHSIKLILWTALQKNLQFNRKKVNCFNEEFEMIKTVSQTTIADVFSITSDKIYKIPKYQREYTWGIKEWDALFNDVTENDFGFRSHP